MIKKGLLFSLVLSLLANTLFSQGFNDVTSLYNINVFPAGAIVQGSGCSFYDFNKDGLDDLTYAVRNDSVVCYRNTGSGFVRMEIVPNSTDIKSAIWVDFDNDGDSDLMTCKRGNTSRFYRNDGNFLMTNITDSLGIPSISGTNIYGCAWGDYDRDGFLDAYFCTLNTPQTSGSGGPILNYLCHNNGNGGFDEVAVLAGVSDGSRENFQPVWIDVNMDGWLDIYLISEMDGGNAMYLNNGDGTFTDVSDLNGSGIEIQSMSNSWSDYDHDGDWDLYTTNDITGNILLQNNEGQFTNVAPAAGLTVESFCWGALWIDYDNNTWEDLHITTATNLLNRDFFYINNGDGTFTESNFSEFALDENFTYSTSKGDFNNDGFYDFTLTKVGSNFQLFEGIPNENNWVKFGFQGTHSNRDAVGTYFEVFADNKKYIRMTQCGEAYLSQDSQYEIVGLASYTQVDSLIIHWPRGLVEKFYNLPANQFYSYIEGENSTVSISTSLPILCGDQSATLDAGEYVSYLWDDGSTDRYRSVSTTGIYSVTVIDENGYELTGEISISAFDHPVVEESVTDPLCTDEPNGTIVVSVIDGSITTIQWNDGNQESSRTDLIAGVYSYSLIDANGCSANGEVELMNPSPIFIEVSTQNVLCYSEANGMAVAMITGGTGTSMIDWGGFDPNALVAGIYEVFVTDENDCSASMPFEITQPDVLTATTNGTDAIIGESGSATITVIGGTEPYQYLWNNGDIDELAENISQGEYTCEVTDANGCQVSGSVIISENNTIAISTSLPILCGDQSATLDAGEYVSYLWDDGSTDRYRSVSTTGIYSVTVIDENGYELTGEISISAFDHPVVEETVTDPLCTDEPNGTIVVSVIDGSITTIQWNDGNQESSRTDLIAGVYSYSLIDANGCSANGEVELINPSPIFIEVSTQNVLCYGEANGMAVAMITGGTGTSMIEWGGFDPNALVAGIYEVFVTDENDCSASMPFEITQPDLLTAVTDGSDAFDGENGSATITVLGGTEPYDYLWSNGDTDELAENIGQGEYTCAVTDANGCEVSGSVSIIDLQVAENSIIDFSVYPNPATEKIAIDANGFAIEKIRITDASGKLVYELDKKTSSKVSIDISRWENGVYFVNVFSINGTQSVPLLIEH